ncbi:AMP-binding protein [Cutibacterium sp. WCA-380-WT-3A]|uniref:AMP-binding protein n=1 Tax=Cutibacterium porci TaxID=2605781 RepID=A0A7K0J709_9ACTN|nr:AMP-binding protein [Cutibacterium porci]MSS45740.1 AMP-binding protein [Cutibacterium porci]
MSIAETSRVRVVRVERTAADVTWLMGRLSRFLDGESSVLVPVGGDELPPAVVQDVEDRVVWLPDEVGLIVRTSGSTTGTGRIVGLSATQMRASGAATRQWLGGPCTWVLGLPPHHIAGLQVVARAVADGRDVVTIQGHVDPSSVTAAIEQAEQRHPDGRVAISLVPTQLTHLIDDPQCAAALARCVAVLVGGAPPTATLLDRARNLGLTATVTYGMSETCGGCVYDGVPLEGVRIEVADDSRVSIAGPMVMSGYLDEGPVGPWLRTQDLGHWADGRLIIDGRVDDVINSGGLKISAPEVLGQVRASQMVLDAVVIGIDDDTWGQVVAALVVPSQQWQGGQALRDAVADRLGRTHAPRVVVETSALPMLASGKVDRVRARQVITQALSDASAWQR